MSKKILIDTEFSAGIKISSGTPGSGKVLTSDGSGNATWQAGGGGTVDSTIIDGSTNAVQGNAVFDALALKQDSLISGTNIKTVNLKSIVGSGNASVPYDGTVFQAYNTNLGTSIPLNPHFAFKHLYYVLPTISGSNPNILGWVSNTLTGTVSSNSPVTTNFRTQQSRLRIVGSAAAGQTASWRANAPTPAWRGNAANFGGFTAVFKFSIPVQPAAYIFYCGMNSSFGAIGATTEASAVTNTVHIGKDSTDTNLQFMVNDASGVCTKTDTGVTASTSKVYCFIIHCEPNGSNMYLTLLDADGMTSLATLTASSNLPTSTSFFVPHQHISNNATATAVECELISFVMETNN